MKKVKNNKNNEENNEKTKKIILIIIAIIIIVLALITSCSCTSKFWGRIGDMFRNEETYIFKEKDGAFCETNLECETIINKELRFDKDYLDVSVSEENIKLSYTYSKINPEELTCTTSDANIATCYVNKDGYVVINPKKEGKVTVILQTKENDKIYQATATINIGKPTKGIVLSSNAGTINLKKTNVKSVSYRLVGIDGKISVTSSDESVATATIKDGILTMTAKKTGKVTFTITVEDNGKTYTATYTLTVVSNAGGSGSGSQGGTTPGKPEDPNKPGSNKDSNNKLSNLTTDTGKLEPVFNENIKKYTINVGAEVNGLTLTATPSSKKATVTYTFDGKTNTSGKIEGLKPGANVVTITVKAEDGSTNIYTVVINKPGTPPESDHDSSLGSLTTNKGDVSPTFDPSVTKGYTKEVGADDTSITIIAKPNKETSKVKYTYYDPVTKTTVTNETGIIDNLQPGDTEVKITVTAQDGKTETEYFVTIKRPHKYEIEFEKSLNECYLEDVAKNGSCKILFTVSKDGVEQHNLKPGEVNLNLPDSYKGTYEIVSNDKENYIVLKPNLNETTKNSEIKLNLTYNGVQADTTVKFKTEDYYLNNQKDKYSMSTDETKSVIFETNLFEYLGGESKDLDIKCTKNGVNVSCSGNKDHITITSNKTGAVYLDVWSVGDKIENIEIKPDGSNYISVSVTANGAGKAEIHAKGSAFGTEVKEVKSDIEIVQKYLVIISAGEGIFESLFDESSKEYEFKVSSNEKIDLSDLDEPIKKAETDCYYYEFIGYANADDPDTIIYSKEDIKNKTNNIITGITGPTKYIAKYKEVAEKREVIEDKVLWAVDIPLFENDEYFEKYGEKKIIYPGAKGSHTMEFKNETDYDIILKGMILEEDTICVNIDGKRGCLNMGYIINSDYDNLNVNNFLYGESNKPTILYKDPYAVDRNAPLPLYTHRREFSFDPSTKTTMTLPAGSNKIVEITIHWEWIFEIDDFNDKVDTAIGNQAAASAKDETINDKYKLKVGIIFDAINKACTSNSKD